MKHDIYVVNDKTNIVGSVLVRDQKTAEYIAIIFNEKHPIDEEVTINDLNICFESIEDIDRLIDCLMETKEAVINNYEVK